MRHVALLFVALALIAGCRKQEPARQVAFDPAEFPTGKTFYKDVLPLVQTHCQKCHQEGGIGPVRFDTYDDALLQSQHMAEYVFRREMPPWMPSRDCGSFRNERVLDDAEIQTFVGWYLDGAPAGEPADAPPPFVAPAGLESPDLVLEMKKAYTPDKTIDDDYRCFVFDPELTAARDLTAFEVVPGDRREVHHVLLYDVDRAPAIARDPNGDGYVCFGGPGLDDASVVGAWVPGAGVVQFPAGTGVRLEPGRAIVMQIHYNTLNGVAPDATEIRYRFSPTPVAKVAQIISGANPTFSIPPGAIDYTASVERTAKAPSVVWGMAPHMHNLGKRARIERTSGECLLEIPEWDFHWQDFYFASTPIQLAAGDTLRFTCTWDNPTDRTITWGESTSDEMCIAYFYVSAP